MKTEKQKSEMTMRSIPKMMVSYDMKIINCNNKASDILESWHSGKGQRLPDFIIKELPAIFSLHEQGYFDVKAHYNNYPMHFTVVPFPEAGYIGFYGTEMLKN